jgi:hypothetical protein
MTIQYYKITYPPEAGIASRVTFETVEQPTTLRKGETLHRRMSDAEVSAATSMGVVAEPVEVERYSITNAVGGSAIPFETVNGTKPAYGSLRALMTPAQAAAAEASGLTVVASPRPPRSDPLSLLTARVEELEAA